MKLKNSLAWPLHQISKRPKQLLLLTIVLLFCIGCRKENQLPKDDRQIAQSIRAKLEAAGFDLSQGFSKFRNGYIVENDIFLTEEQINNLSKDSRVKISTDNLVSGVRIGSQLKDPTSHYFADYGVNLSSSRRTINIYMNPVFGTYLQNSLDSAIARYNALDLSLIFSRTTTSISADIVIDDMYFDPAVKPDSAYLMISGFPSGGNPYPQILINTYFYNTSYNRGDATSSIAHEIGHAIGFRHTDYMNRAFSCNEILPGNNEGNAGLGANHIPGTPSGEENNSWMLACSDYSDRPFTISDIIALKQKYSYNRGIYVKQIWDLIYDNSYYTTFNDYEKKSYDIKVEFYQDAAGTIPYTTAGYVLLKLSSYWAGADSTEYLLVPNGVTYWNIGNYTIDREWEFGNLTLDNTSGYQVNLHTEYLWITYP